MPIALAQRARQNNPHCGDACGYWQQGNTTTLCIVDGLGHGEAAEQAAQAAVQYVSTHLMLPLPDLFAGCDAALRHTRGVAMGIAVIDQEERQLTYAGIGNTRALIAREKTRWLRGDHGIIGAGYKRLVPEVVPLRPGDLVILFTDGLVGEFEISGYGEALRADLQWVAREIIQDWRREADDAAILLYRGEEAPWEISLSKPDTSSYSRCMLPRDRRSS